MGTILLLDDDSEVRISLARVLSSAGWHVIEAESLRDARDAVDDDDTCPDVVFLDVSAKTDDCFRFIERALSRPTQPRIIVSAHAQSVTVEMPVRAFQLGAADFLVKPFDAAALEGALVRALERKSQIAEKAARRTEPKTPVEQWRAKHAPGFLGDDPGLFRAFEVIQKVSDTDCSVLLTGESGTGKELAARAVHTSSERRSRPFVPVNCAAIPENLIESELFGHARGAFTGAQTARAGKFMAADGGTLFLDEIGELPLAMQAKLLRALQEREVTPVGADRSQTVDVRVVAATNRDLEQMVAEGRFREDLLYRLNVIQVELPSLRDRRSDIPNLVHHFIRKVNERRNRRVTGIEPDAMDLLCGYEWPGNVRQLENTVERMVLLRADDELEVSDVPPKIRGESYQQPASFRSPHDSPELPNDGIDLRDAVERFENSLIRQALERSGWNKNRAAAILQINRTTLVEKLKKKDLGEGPGASLNAPTIAGKPTE
jgi:DNA-binding NtrC family response regulator